MVTLRRALDMERLNKFFAVESILPFQMNLMRILNLPVNGAHNLMGQVLVRFLDDVEAFLNQEFNPADLLAANEDVDALWQMAVHFWTFLIENPMREEAIRLRI